MLKLKTFSNMRESGYYMSRFGKNIARLIQSQDEFIKHTHTHTSLQSEEVKVKRTRDEN